MRKCSSAFVTILVAMATTLLGLTALGLFQPGTTNPGIIAVKLMYEFDSVEQLPQQYTLLKKLVSEEDFDKLSIDDELRVVNTYFKFQAMPSKVNILRASDGFVAYTITSESDSITANTVWVFEYEKQHGKLCNIREYKCSNQIECGGEEFDWDSIHLGGASGSLPIRNN